jgi:hypothetical protein
VTMGVDATGAKGKQTRLSTSCPKKQGAHPSTDPAYPNPSTSSEIPSMSNHVLNLPSEKSVVLPNRRQSVMSEYTLRCLPVYSHAVARSEVTSAKKEA